MLFESQSTTRIERPSITFFRTPQNNNTMPAVDWTLNADQGTSPDDGKSIELITNVVLNHFASSEASASSTLTTSRLLIYPDREFLTTKEPVTIHKEGHNPSKPNTIQSTGMSANMKTGVTTLFSNVRTRFYPGNTAEQP
jgi:LPS export ABC transporter protein LptC